MTTVNIIPMSGKGSRFSKEGYLLPKPLISVSGRPMIRNVIESLPPADAWIFIISREHQDLYGMDELLKREIPEALVLVDENPVGQATTCMLAMPHVSDDDSIFISACDNSFLYSNEEYERLTGNAEIDSITWTFTDDDLLEQSPESWGWIRLASDGSTIEDISVKTPVSDNPRRDNAIVGSFFFRKAADFKKAFEMMKEADHKTNGEFYVDSIPLFMNRAGKKNVIFGVDLYVGWGKPKDLHQYEYQEFAYRQDLLKDKKWIAYFEQNEKRAD